ncbi:hypothetical protein BCR35DRAFT_301877 [Leucosporidium creatinivorum]|uniref:F-box domain-containing protein n=1 Tax=Leucosporidium creatinivorum TaxID=106004 RepID=A0A1Y2FWE0_9BASI|nr:hypothetical protein BCR35DRAFT_301877 [Leucosporidium creatinivorum]
MTPNTLETNINLPSEVWLNVLSDSELEYFDLKRVQRVSKSFDRLIKTPFFDPLLFRSQPPSTPPDDDETELHPILFDLDILAMSPSYITIRTQRRQHVVQQLELSRTEMVTYPSTSRVWLKDFGSEALESSVHNPDGSGVTISQLLDAVVDLWGEESEEVWPQPYEMGDFDGRPPTPRQLSLYEVETNSGGSYELVLDEVDHQGAVVLSPCSMSSGARAKATAPGPGY